MPLVSRARPVSKGGCYCHSITTFVHKLQVLDTLAWAERDLLVAYPEYADAKVFVHLNSASQVGSKTTDVSNSCCNVPAIACASASVDAKVHPGLCTLALPPRYVAMLFPACGLYNADLQYFSGAV